MALRCAAIEAAARQAAAAANATALKAAASAAAEVAAAKGALADVAAANAAVLAAMVSAEPGAMSSVGGVLTEGGVAGKGAPDRGVQTPEQAAADVEAIKEKVSGQGP